MISQIVGGAAVGLVFALITARTWEVALSKHGIGASVVQGDTSIPVWQTYFVLPAGLGLMTLVLVYKFVVYLFGLKSGLDQGRASPDDLPVGGQAVDKQQLGEGDE